MSQAQDTSDKTHEPTQRKLDEARKKGDIARSNDVSVTAAYLGLLIALSTIGVASVHTAGDFLTRFLEFPDQLRPLIFSETSDATLGWFLSGSTGPVMSWFAIPAASVCLAILAQRGFVFAPSKLAPKVSRISPLSNAKNKFGRTGLFEFAKSFTKLMLYSTVLGVFLSHNRQAIVAAVMLDPRLSLAALCELLVQFLLVICLVSASIATIDYAWQKQDHLRRNRMSHKDMRDEHKEAEGDPEFKHRRKARAREIATNQMMAEVPKADVVIVNPTHYAVALIWDQKPGSAPKCAAKGTDAIAARIRQTAQEAGVPIQSDPPTARALYAVVEIGEEIRPEHYKPVAAAIRFAQDMRAVAKARGRFGR
ncbi:MAG: flagellar type III secretion system protein FlhB [Rhodobacteraceae bacterium]|nr:flagellar type III secretion system protein FlhB [Paracoccaceae bacterium]